MSRCYVEQFSLFPKPEVKPPVGGSFWQGPAFTKTIGYSEFLWKLELEMDELAMQGITSQCPWVLPQHRYIERMTIPCVERFKAAGKPLIPSEVLATVRAEHRQIVLTHFQETGYISPANAEFYLVSFDG